MSYDLTYISFGAGVQSSALLAMSALGLKGCPKADVAVFADTQDEPPWVYEHLEKMAAWAADHGIEVRTCTVGKLSDHFYRMEREGKKTFINVPVWTTMEDGREAPLRRQCTREYKIVPIEKEVRRLLGFKKGQRIAGKKEAQCLVGISLDEAQRMKPSLTSWVTNAYPLVTARMSRQDCIGLIEKLGLPIPAKSSCVFCPYHGNSFWQNLKLNHPKEFEEAVKFDRLVRNQTKAGEARPAYVHRSLQPLDEVDFIDETQLKLWDDGFGNECEGMCGV